MRVPKAARVALLINPVTTLHAHQVRVVDQYKTAKALGLDAPPMLSRFDAVIQ